jgi:hypothetical protein
LPNCEYKYESSYPTIKFACNEPSIINGKFCIFHDKDHYAEYEQEATKRFEEKVLESISQNKPLNCFGYYLPDINFAKLLKEKTFAQPVYFDRATFYKDAFFYGTTFSEQAHFSSATFSKGADFHDAVFSGGAHFFKATFSEHTLFIGATFSKEASFSGATFSEQANFSRAKFLAEAIFLDNQFTGKTLFRYTLFEQPNKVIFDDSDLSKVSFADSDITRIRFGDGITWGGGKSGFTIIEEEWLKHKAKEEGGIERHEDVSLELVLSVYRNLRENFR